MKAGPMRQVVTVYAPPTATDSYGQRTGLGTNLGNFRAKVTQTAGRELQNANRIRAVATLDVEMRWIDVPLDPTYKLIFNGRTFNIETSINVDERNRTWLLTCKETKNTP